MKPFETLKASQLPSRDPERQWLIEELWDADAVGIIGGEPKSKKSFLALTMAVSVASGVRCLGRFAPTRCGRVLIYAAEDSLPLVRERLEGSMRHHGLRLEELDLWVIAEPAIHLDQPDHCERLEKTVASLQPVFLVLDPFVRLHHGDENVSSTVAPLLAFLRSLQRTHGCAVLLVHHTRKNPGHARAGQTLRGSSELHAWGDSNLYMTHRNDALWLNVEHRGHPACDDIPLRLQTSESAAVALVADDQSESKTSPPEPRLSVEDRVIQVLREQDRPARMRELREACRVRNNTLSEVLRQLVASGRVLRTPQGWLLSTPPSPACPATRGDATPGTAPRQQPMPWPSYP